MEYLQTRFILFKCKIFRIILLTKYVLICNKDLYALYSSPNIIRVIKPRELRWAGHVSQMGASRGAYRILVGNPEGRRSLGRPRRRWVDNIKMHLRDVGWRAWTVSIWFRIDTGGGIL
jgi:hypothetical protein